MKKFIIILMALVFSVSMNAQCVQINQMSQDRIKCYQVELEKSFNQQIAGRNTFLIGLGVQAVGAGLLYASISGDAEILPIPGALLCVGGTITEVAGLCKWLTAYDKTRKLKLGYLAESGGVGAVVIF